VRAAHSPATALALSISASLRQGQDGIVPPELITYSFSYYTLD